jgi:hypothetical protein
MKWCVVIPSCYKDRIRRVPAQREMLKAQGTKLDVRYFYGAGNTYDGSEDETVLPVRDDWTALPEKCRAMFSWAIEHDYDYVFKTDTDTYIHADRLQKASENIPGDFVGLVGSMITQGIPGDCCGGGAGYWLSRLAMVTYLQAYGEFQMKTANWQKNEDWCLYTILHRNSSIRPTHDPRYWDLRLGKIPDERTNITWNEWRP